MTDALLPPEVLQDVRNVDTALKGVEEQLNRVLPNCTPEVMAQLTPLERASTVLSLSKTINALFCLYLRTEGLDPDKHSVTDELERVDLYQTKVQAAIDSKRRPTVNLDIRAANRFIEHAIPDLHDDKKRQLRDLNNKGNLKRRQEKMPVSVTPKRRPSGLTVAEEAAAFLAEASKEIQNANVAKEDQK
ncbi:hypothetical protein R1sor_021122 [Riccia sorocarpa]|uniref:Nuclear nucleic acid-binding protein C1D n=1 Tax=Riccia sorocarpa TaxID=122646 RepID=A0ABD3GHT5_9MARC